MLADDLAPLGAKSPAYTVVIDFWKVSEICIHVIIFRSRRRIRKYVLQNFDLNVQVI